MHLVQSEDCYYYIVYNNSLYVLFTYTIYIEVQSLQSDPEYIDIVYICLYANIWIKYYLNEVKDKFIQFS